MMFEGILIPLITIGLAELGDKSQLVVLNLASKTKNYLILLMGVILAFALVDGVAIVFGGWITSIIPISIIKIISGVLFIFFGVQNFRKKEEKLDGVKSNKGIFLSSFTLIFFSEWGDKTQLSSALFATKYNPVFVFIGIILSLLVLSLIAVFIGRILFAKLNKKVLNFVSGTIFIILGLTFLLFK